MDVYTNQDFPVHIPFQKGELEWQKPQEQVLHHKQMESNSHASFGYRQRAIAEPMAWQGLSYLIPAVPALRFWETQKSFLLESSKTTHTQPKVNKPMQSIEDPQETNVDQLVYAQGYSNHLFAVIPPQLFLPSSLQNINFSFICVYVHVTTETREGVRSPGVVVAGSGLMWVLGTDLQSSTRAVYALKH